MNKSFVIIASLFIFSLFAAPCMKADNLALADSAYSKGEYAEAVDLYKEVARQEGVSSQLWYNMGNAYSKGGFYGKAMVCFIRALRLDPSNSQARANIDYIEAKVAENNRAELKGKKASLEPDSNSFFRNVKLYICRDHLSDTWAVWSAAMFVVFIACLALYIFGRVVILRKIGFFGGLVALLLSLLALVFSFMAASYRTEEGVIVDAKVKLLSDPSASAKENPVALTRGTRMTILDSIPIGEGKAEWYKVRLNSDFVGWIASDDFQPVEY